MGELFKIRAKINVRDISGSLKRRRDIDGLRAVAVLMVFLFHLDFEFIPGGFVGVDVFFVISGYVIFRGTLPDLIDGKFSLIDFYDRRLRRIYPALVLTILICLVAGYVISTPREMDSLGGASLASLFSVSNIYFHDRLDYFAAAARTIPLLHTWSLGIEVQYYLLGPLLIMAALRLPGDQKNILIVTLITIVLLSFAYNLYSVFVLYDAKHAFYMPIARFWEIGAGALIVLVEDRVRLGRVSSSILMAMAILGLTASALLIDSNSGFPGVLALVPVLSTAILIMIPAREGDLYERILTATPFQFLGNISYSLYLLHWPFIVFSTMYLARELSLGEKGMVFFSAVCVSYGSWKYVETPIRRANTGTRRKVSIGGFIAATVTITISCGAIFISQGLSDRLSPEAKKLTNEFAILATEQYACKSVPDLKKQEKQTQNSLAGANQNDNPSYVLWGDSHAQMLARQLDCELASAGHGSKVVTLTNCPPLLDIYTSKGKNRKRCEELGQYLQELVSANKIPLVILASRWGNFSSNVRSPGDGGRRKLLFDAKRDGDQLSFAAALKRTVKNFADLGAHVLLIGPVPEIDFDVPETMIRAAHLGIDIPKVDQIKFEERQKYTLAALNELSKLDDVSVVYPHKSLCTDNTCQIAQGSIPLYKDDDHLNRFGVDLIMPPISQAVRDQLDHSVPH